MATVKFPGSENKTLYLNKFTTHLGTGGIQHRLDMMDDLSEEFSEERMLAFSLSGNLDAPELMPSGAVVPSLYRPVYNVSTEPATVQR